MALKISLSSLIKQVTYGRIGTSIGELYLFSISGRNKSDLYKSLGERIENCSPEKFVREFSKYVCYPKDSLLEGECKSESVVLTDEDIRKLELLDLDNISKLFIEKNKYLYTGRIEKHSCDEEGKAVHPKEDSESYTEYLHRLFILEVKEKKKQYAKMAKSALGVPLAYQNFGDTIARTFSMRDALSKEFESIHNSYHLLAKEESERFRQSLVPNLAVTDFMKAIQPLSTITAIEDITKTTQSLTVQPTLSGTVAAFQNEHLMGFSTVSEMIAAMKQRENQLFSRFTSAEYYSKDLAIQSINTSSFIDRLHQDTFGNNAVQEMMLNQSSVLDSLASRVAEMNAAKFSIPQLSQATMAWDIASSSLTSKMLDIGLLAQRETLSARLFEVPNSYAEFVSLTVDRLAADPTPEIAARLRGSLVLAEYQLLGISDTVRKFIVVPEDDEESDAKRVLDAPFVQQNELLSYKFTEDENNTEALIEISPTAKTVEQARRVLQLVIMCNEAGKTSGFTEDIFKPTTQLISACVDLPWLSATDKRRFGDVVDCLYFIFYEGAGKDNLRFLESHGGPLTINDCDLIWCIKHLRNKWSRHDVDHGKEKEIRKSWIELSEKFKLLGLANHPTETHHFQQLHYKLLVLAENFLVRIIDGLKLK